MTIKLVVPSTPFSQALLDGAVKVDGFDVLFQSADFSGPDASARLRGRIPADVDGAEQVIPDYLVRLARGVGQPLVALPVFLTRGMAHRKLVARVGGRALTDLRGAHIGMSRVLAATAVYLRGFLTDSPYRLHRETVAWLAAEPTTSDDALAIDWPLLRERLGVRAPDLLDLLSQDQLDVVLYPGGGGGNLFYWVESENSPPSAHSTSHYGDLETLVAGRPELHFPVGSVAETAGWFKQTGIYPLSHMVALHAETVTGLPGLVPALLQAFIQASCHAPSYLTPEQRLLYDREMNLLGVDPNEPGLTSLARRSLERILDVLQGDAVLPRRPSFDEIFPLA